MYPNPEQYDNIKKSNEKSFKQLRDSDSFLLKQAVKLGAVKPDEARLVKKLRTMRNLTHLKRLYNNSARISRHWG